MEEVEQTCNDHHCYNYSNFNEFGAWLFHLANTYLYALYQPVIGLVVGPSSLSLHRRLSYRPSSCYQGWHCCWSSPAHFICPCHGLRSCRPPMALGWGSWRTWSWHIFSLSKPFGMEWILNTRKWNRIGFKKELSYFYSIPESE